jgi:hypothetical protein
MRPDEDFGKSINGASSGGDKRGALRLPVMIHVMVYGWIGSEPFSENAETIDVCALGGLVPIAARVRRSQRLMLTNLQTNEELLCRVARVATTEGGRKLAGLAFLQRGPRFWRSGPVAEY